MKVTLVRPTTFLNMNTHPLNLGYIYTSLLDEDYLEVNFVDGEKIGLKYIKDKHYINRNSNHQMWNEILLNILKTKPDVVAFSCYSMSMTATKYIVCLLRKNNFKGYIWAGGIHPTTCYTETLENIDGLNGIVIGEGEETFKEVCRNIHFHKDISNVKGIAYKKEGEIKINEPRKLLDEMSKLPVPSRTFKGSYTYIDHNIVTSRGCPFNCDFCDSKNIWTRRVRYRNSEHVIKEIESMANMGIKRIGIRDDTFTLNKKHVEDICKSIKDKKLNKLEYTVGSRIDTMDDDMISLLQEMNVDMVTLGVESGSSVIQKRMKKNLDINTVIPTVLKINKAGIRSITFFMIGHPGETERDIEDSYSLIRDLSKYCKRNMISINTVCPYPGTGYWEYAINKYGDFIDFYKDSYKYYHQEKPIINLTNMEDKVLLHYILRFNRFAKIQRTVHRINIAIKNPSLLLSKIKNRFFSKKA